jgi:hypothetical protein
MKLQGSCHCGAVRFSLQSDGAVPYQRCYCSICRKTQGGGGFAVNLGGDAATLVVRGRKALAVYRARSPAEPGGRSSRSQAQRNFCKHCGSALWVFDPRWPDLVHPFASAIDTPLPVPPARTHLMLAYQAPWCEPDIRPTDLQFDEYPQESIAQWHDRHGLGELD